VLLNYLLKPVDPDDLQSTIKKLEEKTFGYRKRSTPHAFLDNMKNMNPTTQRIALSTG
jgi:YesN/AraC family two-component response regulator